MFFNIKDFAKKNIKNPIKNLSTKNVLLILFQGSNLKMSCYTQS